jgi:RNA polymerase sigma-70 factor (ECF subfamily)
MKPGTSLPSAFRWALAAPARRAFGPTRPTGSVPFPVSLPHAPRVVTDQALIACIVGRDRAAMRMLYARHHVRVYRFALRLLRDEPLSEDIVSEVFLEVWRNADRFEGRSAVSTWLLGIARLKALSALKRFPEEAWDERGANTLEDPADDPASCFERTETRSLVRQCLSRLSPQHREVIDLVYFHDKSIAEVAEIVGIPCNTVKTRMFHARKRLAFMLRAAGIE